MRGAPATTLSAGLTLLFQSVTVLSRDISFYGCYSSSGSLNTTAADTSEFQSSGRCRSFCVSAETKSAHTVVAMNMGGECYCGDSFPGPNLKVDSSKCDEACGGWPQDTCGSANGKFWSFYNTGVEAHPDVDSAGSSTSSAASIATASSTASSVSSSTSSSASSTSTNSSSVLDVSNPKSIKAAAKTIADNLMTIYSNSSIPGLLPTDFRDPSKIFYWWEAGAVLGAMVDYWKLTGDDTYNDKVREGLLWQVGDNKDYEPANQTLSLGNDDQSIWALSAISAAEESFPQGDIKWLDLAAAVSDRQIARWDNTTCGGGLRWMAVSTNAGYNYKNTDSNAQFLQLNARLAMFTGNKTYLARAEMAQKWLQDSGLITNDWTVYDGVSIKDNQCTDVSVLQWSSNAGTLLEAYAYLYNMTSGNSSWKKNLDGLLANSLKIFLSDGIIEESACESVGTCNTDQEAFKGQFAASLGQTMKLAPYTTEKILPALQSSAIAAYKTCKKMEVGMKNLCLSSWTGGEKATMDVSAQFAALQVVQNALGTSWSIANSSTPTVSTSASGDANSTQSGAASSTSPNAGNLVQIRWSVLMGAPVIALGFVAFG